MYKIIKVFCCRSCLDGCLGRFIGQGFREVRKDLIVRDDQMMACFVQDRLFMQKLRGYNFDEIQDCGNLSREHEDELIEMARRGKKNSPAPQEGPRLILPHVGTPDGFWKERIDDAVDSAVKALSNPMTCPMCGSTNVAYANPTEDQVFYCKNCARIFYKDVPNPLITFTQSESTQEERFGGSRTPKKPKAKKPKVKTVETKTDRSIDLE